MPNLTNEQLVEGLMNEWLSLIHDGFGEDDDPTEEERLQELQAMTREQLLEEASREEDWEWENFIACYL